MFGRIVAGLALSLLASAGAGQIALVEASFDGGAAGPAFAARVSGEGARSDAAPRAEGGALRLLRPWWRSSASAAFEAPTLAHVRTVRVGWTLRMTLGTEGAGFVWLDTERHGVSGEAPDVEAWEAPGLAGCFGVGFDASDPVNHDIFRGSGNIYGRPEHEVSLHWDGAEIVKRVSPVDFRDDTDHEVHLTISFATGGAEVTLSIDGEAVFERYPVPTMSAYVGRAAFGGRNGETAGSVAIDGVRVECDRAIAEPGAPLGLVAIERRLNDAAHPRHEATVEFPDDLAGYGRIVCTIRLDEPETRFDPWDRVAHVYVYDDAGERYELVRYVTPYHKGHEWRVDVSDFRPLLAGPTRVEQVCSTQGEGWVVTVRFDLYPGPAERVAVGVVKLWEGQCVIGDPDRPPSEFYTGRSVPVPEGAAGAVVRTVITGHGMSPNSQNAAEFMPIWRTLTVNGQPYRNRLWKTDNYLNPCRPQGGTWKFDRAGWAPGDVVRPWEVEVSHLLAGSGALELGYELDPYINENRGQTWSPFHLTEGHVVFYREP